ncbi:NADP-dependent oxidoreductase [Nocardioides seonyuensis]|uniref:NADP-dependent oxidoreductase n=1 Tax=Nocardioides seonyuensis TaxID=2518371 RepID=A0A4P7IIP2_9ACTN|nr:NADP-dependent oxidoreductase [Nocardioides seonyuensis]QBX57256.1 NADP-dependent oxidoreductase [Nocardioides seonyuensis]
MNDQTSRRAVVRDPSGSESIEIINVPIPQPGAGQVRIEVAAAAINPVDLGVASGRFHQLGVVHQPVHTGLGWDFAGTVEAVGDGVTLTVGTLIAKFVDGFDRDYGSHADHVVVDAAHVAPLPDGMFLNVAAGVPLAVTTAGQLVKLIGAAPAAGRRLLVTGAAGAVGAHFAILAKEHGWEVTGLARAGDEEFVRGLGVEFVDETTQGWDVVVDAAAMQAEALRLVRDGGRFVGVQPALRLPEERGITVDVVVSHPDVTLLSSLLERVAAGHLPARIHATLPLTEIVSAYQLLAKGNVRGRIVVVP